MFNNKKVYALVMLLTLAQGTQTFDTKRVLKSGTYTAFTVGKLALGGMLAYSHKNAATTPLTSDSSLHPKFIYFLAGSALLLETGLLTFTPYAFGLQSEFDKAQPVNANNELTNLAQQKTTSLSISVNPHNKPKKVPVTSKLIKYTQESLFPTENNFNNFALD